MKVAITGSAGFIGSNLTEACLRKGWEVRGIDNLSTGSDEMADPIRYMELPGSYSFMNLDINETEKLTECFRGCDVVFHMAALPRVQYSTDYPVVAHNANINGTLSVLEAARAAKVKRVVYSASSSMYGGSNIQLPTPETTPAHPISNYGLQKYVGLEYCRMYSELYGLDTVSLVYFNVFGDYQRADNAYAGAIPAFLSAAIQNKPCRIDGDGTHSRDWTHVDNVVQANLLAAEHPHKLNGQHFNAGCGESYSVNDVFYMVGNLLGKLLHSDHQPERQGDPVDSMADISKAKEILGYKPVVDFKTGMKLTSQWWLDGCPIK